MTTESDMSASKAYTLTIVTLNDTTWNPISADDSFYEKAKKDIDTALLDLGVSWIHKG
jgi:hypothetical protein